MDIQEQLLNLGLKTNSAKAYIFLLGVQKAGASQIARESDIKRTTIYKILQELIAKQLVSETRNGKRIIYIAESPDQLQYSLLKQSQILKNLLPILHSIESNTGIKPIIKYYEGREAILKIYKETLKCKEKIFRNLAAVPNVEKLLGSTFIDHYTDQRIKKRILTKSLRSFSTNKTPIKNWYLKDENIEVLRETRYLDISIKIDAFIKIYDNIVLLISFGKIPSAIVVENPDLAQTMKALFDVVWSSAKIPK